MATRKLAPDERAAVEASGRTPALRLAAGGETVRFTDRLHGPSSGLVDDVEFADRLDAGACRSQVCQFLRRRPGVDTEDLRWRRPDLCAEIKEVRDDLLITVRIADRAVLGQVVRRLDDEGIVVDDLSLRRPSLDEVFLTLTGHPAEAEEVNA